MPVRALTQAAFQNEPDAFGLAGYFRNPAIVLTVDGGRIWRTADAPGLGARWYDLALQAWPTVDAIWGPTGLYLSTDHGHGDVMDACGGEPSAGSQRKALYVSDDAARTWRQVATTQGPSAKLPAGYLTGMAITGAQTAYLELSRYPLQQTSDGGHLE